MKVTIVSRITIAADQKIVFEYLSHLKYHRLWNPHLRSISSKQRLSLGSTYTTESIVLNIKLPAHNTVTKCREPSELEIQNSIGILQWQINYKLKTQGKTVIVTCSSIVTTSSKGFVFTAPILRQLARRELQTDLQSLKIAVENRLE